MDADHESLELAMALHRELNAPQRRSRRDIEEEKRAKEEQKRKEAESSSSSSSDEDDEDSEDDHDDGAPDQGKEEAHPHLQGAAARRAKHKRRRKSPPRQLDPHEIAATIAVQKAAKAAKSKSGPIGHTHCKCFIAGIPWGVIIPKEALESRQSLSEAASRAFEKDGFVCRAEELEISIVAASKTVEHFPAPCVGVMVKKEEAVSPSDSGGGIKNALELQGTVVGEENENGGGASSVGEKEKKKEPRDEGDEELQERWAAATQQAQRVYLSKIKLQNS